MEKHVLLSPPNCLFVPGVEGQAIRSGWNSPEVSHIRKSAEKSSAHLTQASYEELLLSGPVHTGCSPRRPSVDWFILVHAPLRVISAFLCITCRVALYTNAEKDALPKTLQYHALWHMQKPHKFADALGCRYQLMATPPHIG